MNKRKGEKTLADNKIRICSYDKDGNNEEEHDIVTSSDAVLFPDGTNLMDKIDPLLQMQNKLLYQILYLDAENGDDSNDGLTSDTPMRTMKGLWNKYKGTLYLLIELKPGIYDCGITFYPVSNIVLLGEKDSDTIIVGSPYFYYANIYCKYIKFQQYDITLMSKPRFISCMAHLEYCTFSTSYVASNYSKLSLLACSFEDWQAIGDFGSHIIVDNCTTNNETYDLLVSGQATILSVIRNQNMLFTKLIGTSGSLIT